MPNRRRPILCCLLILLFAAAQATMLHAATRNPDDYPLLVHIYDKHQHHVQQTRHFYTYIGNGRGNITEGDQIHAMEYNFDCVDSFLTSEAGEDYPAKWKKPGLSLELLMGVIGSDTKTRTCVLQVALKDYIFTKSKGKIVQISQQQYLATQSAHAEREQALAPPDIDPSHYPLELSLLNLNWTGSTSGMHSGSGQGDLKVLAGLAAVDFAIRCPIVIQTTPEGRYYRAKWTQPGHAMTLLLGNIADPAAGATCELTTSVNTDVYVLQSAGVVKAISQDQYNKQATTP